MSELVEKGRELLSRKFDGSLKVVDIMELPVYAIKNYLKQQASRLFSVKSTYPCVAANITYLDGYGVDRPTLVVIPFRRSFFRWVPDEDSMLKVKGVHSLDTIATIVNDMDASGVLLKSSYTKSMDLPLLPD